MPDFDTLESLNRALEELQSQRQRLFERERAIAIQRLQSFVEMYAIQPQELGFGRASGSSGAARPRAAGQRYVDPATGRSWGGRGARPAWLREALRAGGKLEDFLVVSDPLHIPAAARVPAPPVPYSGRSVYRDPVTQQTWGGRGAHPAWLRAAIASGRDKQEFLVGGPPTGTVPHRPDLAAQIDEVPAPRGASAASAPQRPRKASLTANLPTGARTRAPQAKSAR